MPMSSHDDQIKFGDNFLAWALLHFPVWMLVLWSVIGSATAAVPISLFLHFVNIPTENFPHWVIYLVTFAWMSASASLMLIIARNRKIKTE